ncbi:MAG TPA: HEPN domain-containing protein [Pyrinomonadaceae bacterium]|nr:HEPN domain-containing protein [Pyrinomonadaceae bacterium]
MSDFDKLHSELEAHISSLEAKFIKPFLPSVNPLATPAEYEYDVKAYCVLSHAAIEEFFESVSLKVMSLSFDEWVYKKKNSDTLTALVCNYRLHIDVDTDERNSEKKCFDYLRPVFEEAVKRHSNDVHKNHGASITYLRKLMIPVAVDVKDDIKLKNSLNQLAKERGEYAHKQTIKKFLSPEDAKNYVDDCLSLCDDIRVKVNNMFI